jgi:hypothetical protein
LDNLKVDDFEIRVTRGSPNTIEWLGISHFVNPSSTINPFVEVLAETLKGESVIVDFTKLAYMNSSTVSPIIHLCKLFDKKRILTTVHYDKTSDWQSAIFRGLETLSRLIPNLTVEPVIPST